MKSNPKQPPRWAQRFLEWYCKPSLLEDLQGDLLEYFERHVIEKGLFRAKIIYVVDVFKFMRLYTIRKPEFFNILIHWIMLGSYIKTSGRSLVRNKLFSFINVIGLAISMSVGLLMIAFLNDMLAYDDFHENSSRIYRVNSFHEAHDGRTIELASTSVRAGKKIEETLTGFEKSVLLRRGLQGDAEFGETIIPLEGLWAQETFFQIFTFPLISGNLSTALKEPYSIVLTEKAAQKLFGDVDPLGKAISFRNGTDTASYTVTAVMKDVPKFSHMQFEILCSFSTLELKEQSSKDFYNWGSVWMNYVYVLFPPESDIENFEAALTHLANEENKGLEHAKVTLNLQKLKDIALGKDLSNAIGPQLMIIVVYVLGGLAFVVILSACFNYTNLSIARSLRRSKEVGIRKVIGAGGAHVFGQFIVESVLISLFALAFSFLLFLFLRPQFLSVAPEFLSIVQLDLSPMLLFYFLCFAIGVGIVAGLIPAAFFSKVNAVKVLKDLSAIKVFKNLSARKTLIVVQYCFSLMFITATVLGYKQYKYFIAFDLGFDTANILNIELQGNRADNVIKVLKELPEVEGVSKSVMITSVGSYWGSMMKYNDPNDSSQVWYNIVDENYIPLHGHQLLAGTNFTSRIGKAEETEVIVNEQVLKRMNIANHNPDRAIGEILKVDNKNLRIVGVMKDYHYGKVDSKIDPVIFRYSNDIDGFVSVKVNSSEPVATIAAIESKWKQIDRVHPLKAKFYDDQIEESYQQYSAITKVIGFLGFLAITISSMGLLGMVVFVTETRLKEISIRKVLGASETKLILILSRGFLILLFVSALIALPLTYIFFEQVVLSEFVYRAPTSVLDMVICLAVVMAVAILMIGSQTMKVARSNPAEVLKTE